MTEAEAIAECKRDLIGPLDDNKLWPKLTKLMLTQPPPLWAQMYFQDDYKMFIGLLLAVGMLRNELIAWAREGSRRKRLMNARDDDEQLREQRYEQEKRMDVIVPAQSGWYVVTAEKPEDGTRALYHTPIIAWSIFEDKEGCRHYVRPILPPGEEMDDTYLLKSPDGKYMSGSINLIIIEDDTEALQALIERKYCGG
jgi:hypothetical protein